MIRAPGENMFRGFILAYTQGGTAALRRGARLAESRLIVVARESLNVKRAIPQGGRAPIQWADWVRACEISMKSARMRPSVSGSKSSTLFSTDLRAAI